MTGGRLNRGFLAHPRSLAAIAWLAFWRLGIQPSTRLIGALDIGGVAFLALIGGMVGTSSAEGTRDRAERLDEGPVGMVVAICGAAFLGLGAIVLETRGAKNLPPDIVWWHLALAAGSIVLAWLVTHALFGLHYAHRFYGNVGDSESHRGGLEIPGAEAPDYWDFLYFSFTVGMTCQTSDVQVTGHTMRRLTLVHGVLSFFFNTVVLALAINIAASLL
jgi:uncharacterized membrane protein